MQVATKEAVKLGIPLIADTQFKLSGDRVAVFRHYDYLNDLSNAERLLIQAIVKDAARRIDCEVATTLNSMEFLVV